MGCLRDYLAETRRDIKEMLNIEVILVTSCNEGTARVDTLEAVVVSADVFNKFGLLFAARGAVERADDDIFY